MWIPVSTGEEVSADAEQKRKEREERRLKEIEDEKAKKQAEAQANMDVLSAILGGGDEGEHNSEMPVGLGSEDDLEDNSEENSKTS